MDAQQRTSQPTIVVTPAPAHETCEQCGAPVDLAQRYCVQCGTRRKHVSDPAARFMSSATSRARAAARAQQQTAGSAGRNPRGVGLGLALAVALIPAGVGLGVVIGHSNTSSNNDAALIAALKSQKQEVINVGGGASTGASSGNASGASTKAGSSKKAKTTTSASSSSSTAGPSATGYKPSASALKTGAAVVSQVQKTVGKSYVGSQQGLPSVVSVP